LVWRKVGEACWWHLEAMARNRSQFSIRIHRSGWLLIAVFIAFGVRDLGLRNGVMGALMVVVSLLLHEVAHTATAVVFHVPVHGIGLKLLGAYTHRKYASRPLHDVLIAASGPLASLVLTYLSFFLPRVGFDFKVGVWLAEWNFSIAVINLVPFPGTDGYRMLKSMLWPDAAVYAARAANAA
jgi:Zn-dependent protease